MNGLSVLAARRMSPALWVSLEDTSGLTQQAIKVRWSMCTCILQPL
jgi:hypothetical protein